MNNPIRILQDEHELLLSAISTGKQIQEIRNNEQYHNKVHDIILFFRNFTELYHHPKEDQILYPLLEGRDRRVSPQIIHELCNEHEDLEQLLADIIDAHVAYEYANLRAALSKYLQQLSMQIETENDTVLSMASQLLSNEESGHLYEEFIALDRRDGTKDTLHKRYTKLAS